MLDSAAMDPVRLRFPGQSRPDRPLPVGMHAIVGGDGGPEVVDGGGGEDALALCVDRRGVWMTVPEGRGGVHVNGRPIRRMAMLRAGDAIHVDGHELRLLAPRPPEVPAFPPHRGPLPAADARVVLRGIGGRHHGCSVTLEQPRLVGRHAGSDIRIDDPELDDRHARVELVGDQVILRDLGSARGSEVNGEPVRDAVLRGGDQVAFDGRHRFVVEAPRPQPAGSGDGSDAADSALAGADGADAARRPAWRWPWLLISATVLAALLAALLLFGPA